MISETGLGTDQAAESNKAHPGPQRRRAGWVGYLGGRLTALLAVLQSGVGKWTRH